MAKHNIFDIIMKTIDDVKQQNQSNPNEETAHPNVFDLIKGKLNETRKVQVFDDLQRISRNFFC